jgi:uncharacterized membrane-anchored protein YitT (DUF2179 family)
VIAFSGTEQGRATTLLYAIVRRKQLRALVTEIKRIDPKLFYAVEPLRESNIDTLGPLPHPTGWRSVFKAK